MRTRSIIWIVTGALLGGALTYFAFSSAAAAVIGGITGAFLAFVANRLAHTGTTSSRTSQATPDKNPTADVEGILSGLVELGIGVRENALPPEIATAFDAVVDWLFVLIPRLNESDAGGEMTWVVNRMATDYLPKKIVHPYLQLGAQERVGRKGEMLQSLGLAAEELAKVQRILDGHAAGDFTSAVAFMRTRFLNPQTA